MELIQTNQQKDKIIFKNADLLRDLWDIGQNNTCIIGVLEGKESKKGAENIFQDILAKNFPNIGKETDIQVQEDQTVPNKMNPKRSTPGHIIQMVPDLLWFIF